MISLQKRTLVTFLYFLTATSAYAQMCREPGSTTAAPKDHVWIDCDMTYRNLQITCDNAAAAGKQFNAGTRPSCPSKPMPMIQTPNRSIIREYSPYLFAYPRDKDDKSLQYNGAFRTGTQSGPDKVYDLLGNVAGTNQSIAACVNQLKAPQIPGNSDDQAKLARLQVDNCANQYLLRASMFPYQDSRARLLNNPEVSSDRISLETECQPLKINSAMRFDNEYNVADYLKAAWIKSMQDPNYRMNFSLVTIPALVQQILSAAHINIPNILANTSEPHYPKNTILNPAIPFPDTIAKANQIGLKETFPTDLRPTQIMATPYEKIFDPTHPFSPRWDFPFNERDFYSPMVAAYQSKWYDNSKAVYCAGVREAKNKSGKEKRDLEVHVDVLRFREKAFTEGIMQRIGFNTECKIDNSEKKGRYPGIPDGNILSGLNYDPTTFCIKPRVIQVIACEAAYAVTCAIPFVGCQRNIYPCNETAQQMHCWDCYKLGSDKVDDENKHPPCTTHYDGKDQKIKAFPVLPGLRNEFRWKAPCRILPFIGKRPDIVKLCSDLRRPYTNINRLKMRYHNSDDADNNALGNLDWKSASAIAGNGGPSEGMSFNDYFDNRMPYPRIWDTGTSLHKSVVKDTNYQSPTDTTGQYTTIVGVGREGAPKSAGDDAQKQHPDERCRYGGWGSESLEGVPTGVYLPVGFLGLEPFALPDPMTSWTEFKLYQARTMRYTNISCIGRYEKVFKSGATENLVLAATGGEWSRVVVAKCPRNHSTTCTYMSLKDYQDAKYPKSDKDYYVIPQTKLENWPLAWRGYVVSGTTTDAGGNPITTGKTQFPNFAATVGASGYVTTTIGLNNAQLGDVLLLPRGASKLLDKPGLAKVAIVADVNLPNPNKGPDETDCTAPEKHNCYIDVLEADNGKNPDVCGTTDAFGTLKSRRIFPPGYLPKPAQEEYTRIGSTANCEDPSLNQCIMPEWDSMSLYRIREDIRIGCDKKTSIECAEKK